MQEPIVLDHIKIPNARDLGGYLGADGRKILKKRLLRTGKIIDLSNDDKKFLINYGVKTVIDLRTPSEYNVNPDTPIEGVEDVHIPVHRDAKLDTKLIAMRQTYDKIQYAGFKSMCYQYRRSITEPFSQNAFKKILETLASQKDGATIFHCSEGKDRTGLTTVFIIYLLGVNWETIRQDYLYSNFTLRDYQAAMDKKIIAEGGNDILRSNIRSLAGVANEYLDTALLTIKQEYDGIDNFIHNQLGLDQEFIQEFRNLYLEVK